MKFLVYIFLFLSFGIAAQTSDVKNDTVRGEEIFSIVEEMPEFPGGPEKMMKFVQKTINYPKKEKESKIGGKVFLKFTVEATGSIKDIIVMKSSGNENLDKEAVRVVTVMPTWNPAKQQGRPVPVFFNLPINFNPH